MKTINQLFKGHQQNKMAGGFVAPYLRYADFADALSEHDNETIKLIDDMIAQHEKLNKLFPCEKNDEKTTAVKIALNNLKNKLK